MDQLHTANKVCGGCCAISLNTVDTESSVSPIRVLNTLNTSTDHKGPKEKIDEVRGDFLRPPPSIKPENYDLDLV